ncbi:MAG: hypothetical protein HY824_11960 [Acidobacteria bacterium]|nr:hypothetical protein [Acidobacteriota bacterium]
MATGEPVIDLRGVVKHYGGLRPLRIERLVLRQGETVALLGFDQTAAEALVNLVTAATLPDEGDVDIFGAPTSRIGDADGWFRSLDRFGIIGSRAVLIDELTVEQNLALPFSFALDDIPPDVRRQVDTLADEVGILSGTRQTPMAAADPMMRIRVRLAKALALDPRVLLAEHPSAAVPAADAARLAADLKAVARQRDLAMLVLTADPAFAAAACDRVLMVRPATGALAPTAAWRRWFERHDA